MDGNDSTDRSPGNVDRIIEQLAQEGREATEGAFTLDRETALRKMSDFQLAEPESYVLELVQAAVLKDADEIIFAIDADDMEMRYRGRPFTLTEFDHLYAAPFAGKSDPDTRACAELALGLNAAMAMNPRYIRVRSGNGQTGALLERRPGQPDRYEPLKDPPDHTEIHIKARIRPGLIVKAAQNVSGRLPQEKLLKERCRFCRAMMELEGYIISAGLDLPHVDGRVDITAEGLKGCGGFVEDMEHSSVVHLVTHGVHIATHGIAGEPTGFEAVVEADTLSKDLSQRELVRNEAYDSVIDAVQAARSKSYGRILNRALAKGGLWDWDNDPTAKRLAHTPRWNVARRGVYEFRGIWGSSPTDLHVVTANGHVIHFNGRSWHTVMSAEQPLMSIHGCSASDVYAVGQAGSLLHHDGERWRRITSNTSAHLLDVFALSPDAVFAVGNGGTILKYDGEQWRYQRVMDTNLSGVWADMPNHVITVGENLENLCFNGERWKYSEAPDKVPPSSATLSAVWGHDADHIYAVGRPQIIARWDRGTWEMAHHSSKGSLFGIWGSSGDDIFAVGEYGLIFHYDGQSWKRISSGVDATLYGVWGFSSSDVYAVGNEGTVLHFDGRRWRNLLPAVTRVEPPRELLKRLMHHTLCEVRCLDMAPEAATKRLEELASKDPYNVCVWSMDDEDRDTLDKLVSERFEVVRE